MNLERTLEDEPKALAYPVTLTSKVVAPLKETKKMVLRCKSCGQEFDSTFSIEEFSMLSKEQYEAGTLHLCPSCGNLSIYTLKDYKEP
jgi:predicted RNA-binding Zn-ribbon protein involved in translation (DUF1610 family)